jgi:hypothetical protein
MVVAETLRVPGIKMKGRTRSRIRAGRITKSHFFIIAVINKSSKYQKMRPYVFCEAMIYF